MPSDGSCYYLQATQVTLATVVSGSGMGDCGNYQHVARGSIEGAGN